MASGRKRSLSAEEEDVDIEPEEKVKEEKGMTRSPAAFICKRGAQVAFPCIVSACSSTRLRHLHLLDNNYIELEASRPAAPHGRKAV